MLNSGLVEAFMEARPALLRYLMLRGATADEAQDIVQDVYLKISVTQIGPVDQPRAYLYRMANNHFLLHRRTRDRRSEREEAWVDARSGDAREVDDAPSAEAEMIAREQLAIMQRTLSALPERTRVIFRRFRVDGEPQRQIAEDIGISVSAVEKHLARAYEAIAATRARLDEEDGTSRSLTRGSHHGN